MVQERLYVLKHLGNIGLLLQKVCDRLVLTGQMAQLGFIVRVRQHAHIEHIVGVARNAAFESKRFEHQRQLLVGCGNQ